MAAGNRQDEAQRDEPNGNRNTQWEGFKDFVKKIAAVPKAEVDELKAEQEREKKEKRAG